MAASLSQSEVEGKGEGGKYSMEGVEVSIFDHCIDNFFSDMESISNLCSSSSQHDLDFADIDRFSSMITFLKEWKYFQYEPRNVSFSCGSEKGVADANPDPVRRELDLPQFSSAAVPKAAQFAGETDSSSSDFVLYAGGSVWALDWCPRADDRPDSAITCEYLAVSAHPPGSNYHEMGASLMGRGAIQIWCLVTTTETIELSKPAYNVVKGRPKKKDGVENDNQKPPTAGKPRGRPKKKDGVENDNQKSLTAKKARGRPKKVSLIDPTSGNQVAEPKKIGRPRKRPRNEEDACITVPKKRGRPRKYALCSTFENVDELLLPVSFDLEGTTTVLALPPPPDTNSTEKGSKGRCKKGNSQGKKSYKKRLKETATVLALPPPPDANSTEKGSKGRCKKGNYQGKKLNKRRLKEKGSVKKPDLLAEDNSIVQDVTSTEWQIVQLNSTEAQCNAEAKLASSVCCPKETLLPKLVFCLAHYGKVAWDIKWKPFIASSSARMGYLAVLLGNGSLEVWEVPVPSTVQRLYSSNPGRGEGTDPRFLKLKPVFRCSKVAFGNRQSIPLTLEWSPSPPSDMILAGCHDGTVALWKFAIHTSCEDSRPLLVFTADSAPIRSLSWAPHESDNAENANLFVTAGPEGLKFWDIRDPYHSLWEVNPAHRAVVSVDWLKDPRCILMSLEDGTMRIFSFPEGANDLPVTGMPLPKKQFEGLVAYCVTDGSLVLFQLTERFLEPDPTRNRTPYFLCDSFKEEGGTLELGAPFRNTIIPNLPLKPIKGPSRYITGDDKALVSVTDPPKKRYTGNEANAGTACEGDDSCGDAFPSKLVALHKVRWNKNKGTERWLCYGGAAGIIRCQKISLEV